MFNIHYNLVGLRFAKETGHTLEGIWREQMRGRDPLWIPWLEFRLVRKNMSDLFTWHGSPEKEDLKFRKCLVKNGYSDRHRAGWNWILWKSWMGNSRCPAWYVLDSCVILPPKHGTGHSWNEGLPCHGLLLERLGSYNNIFRLYGLFGKRTSSYTDSSQIRENPLF